MIRSFRSRETEKLFVGQSCAKFRRFERVAQRKLRQLDAAMNLGDLLVFPGNRLETLKGDRRGQHSIRINDQWRICFIWKDGNADDGDDVEIVDYH